MNPVNIGAVTSGALVYLLSVIAFGIAGYYVYRRILHPVFSGRQGEQINQPLKRLAGALGVVFSQKCVLRHVSLKDRAGLGHFIIFWSFISFMGMCLIFIYGEAAYHGFALHILGKEAVNIINYFLDIAGLCLLGALIWAALRRYVAKPLRLSSELTHDHDALITLILIAVFILAHFLTQGFAYATSGASEITQGPVTKNIGKLFLSSGLSQERAATFYTAFWWIRLIIILVHAIHIPFSKHSHIIIAPLAIFLRSLQHRGALEYVKNHKEAKRYGGTRVRDFTWKQLLDGYSCARCGRCSQACPATISGKPLSPMHVVHSVRQCLTEAGGQGMRSDDKILFGDDISEESIWNCTTCLACQEECPNLIEHVSLIVELRRHLIHKGRINRSGARALEAMLLQGNPWDQPARTRLNWIEGNKVNLLREKQKAEVLYWVGCAGAYDLEAINAAKAMIGLLERANIDYAILGTEEICCGETARRMGEEGLWQTLAQKNIEVLGKYSFDRILTTCPHCYNTFKNEYPQLGAMFQVVHHSEFLLELIREGRLKLNGERDLKLTFHDPCYLGRYNGMLDMPRELLQKIPGALLRETESCRGKSLCCGAGGGQMWIQSEKGQRMEEVRFEQLFRTDSKVIATACPYCNIMLSAAASSNEESALVKIMDIAELIDEATVK